VGVGGVACAAHVVSTAIKAMLKIRRAIKKMFGITHRKKSAHVSLASSLRSMYS